MQVTKSYQKVNIEITNICNLQCSFCPEVVRTKGMMSTDLFKHVIEQVAPLTEQVCLHLMGDPLVHPDLQSFVDVCAKAHLPIFLVTNGVLLREKQADVLLHPTIRQVNFSLHSFPDNFPDKDPTPYLERIFTFTERAFEVRPELYINYRLWNLTHPGASNAQNEMIAEKIEQRFQTELPKRLDVREQKSFRIKNRLYVHYDTEFTWPALDLEILGSQGTCYGLKSHFGILVDGTVVPCCLDKEGVIPLGNIQSTPIRDILMSPRARSMVQGFQKRTLVEELCKRCNYIERFSLNSSA